MRECHSAHGKLKIRLFLDPGTDAKGRADQKASTALAGQLHILQLCRKILRGNNLALRGKNTEPAVLQLWHDG